MTPFVTVAVLVLMFGAMLMWRRGRQRPGTLDGHRSSAGFFGFGVPGDAGNDGGGHDGGGGFDGGGFGGGDGGGGGGGS